MQSHLSSRPESRFRDRRAVTRIRNRFRSRWERLENRTVLSSYMVTSLAYSASTAGTLAYEIQSAIMASDSNAIIDFSLPASTTSPTISLNSGDVSSITSYGPTAYVISGESVKITINGAGAPGLVINGGSAVRPFAVEPGTSLNLENLTLEDGLSQGGNGGNGAGGGGGGGGAGLGGAVFVDGATFTAQGVTFINNMAAGGSGGSGANNLQQQGGGGGGRYGNGEGYFPTSVGNAGGSGGGGAGGTGGNGYNGQHGTFGGGGGAGGNTGGHVGNTGGSGGFGGGGGGGGGSTNGAGGGGAAGFGGGPGNNGQSGVDHSGSGGGGGGGAGLGGGIFSNNGTVTLINDTFTANTAAGGNGGQGSTGYASNGFGFGGALFAVNGTVTALFDTFSSNTAESGITTPTAVDGTDVYILSDGGDTGVNGSAATVTITDSILGQSTHATSDFVANYFNLAEALPTMTASFDLLSNNSPLNATYIHMTGLTGTNLIDTANPNPMLGSLAYNGGPTNTMAYQVGSPVIDAGTAVNDPDTSNPITTDQRAASRFVPPSIGSYDGILITPPTLPSAIVNVPYSQQFTAYGGTDTGFTFTATGLPPGVSLSPSGMLTGTPTSNAGSPYQIQVTCIDSDSNTATIDYTLPVTSSVQFNIVLTYTTASQGTTLFATVSSSPSGSSPTGTVNFYQGSTLIGTAPILNGIASLFIGTPAPGTYTYSSVFNTTSTSSNSITINTNGPEIVGLSREGFNIRPTVIVLTFNQSLNVTSAQNPANYLLYSSTGHRYSIATVLYDPTNLTVSIVPARRLPVAGTFMLEVIGTSPSGVTNINGYALEGSAANQPGTNFITRFNWRALAAPNAPPAITYMNGVAATYQGPFTLYFNAVFAATQYFFQHAVSRHLPPPDVPAKSNSTTVAAAQPRLGLNVRPNNTISTYMIKKTRLISRKPPKSTNH